MKKIVWSLSLGLCLNTGCAMVQKQKVAPKQEILTQQRPIGFTKAQSNKFSNLVKSTMDLMAPKQFKPLISL